MSAPDWFVAIVDKLRGDYKDGNWLRSQRVAQELLDNYMPTKWPDLARMIWCSIKTTRADRHDSC
jgi:hypothetical protein